LRSNSPQNLICRLEPHFHDVHDKSVGPPTVPFSVCATGSVVAAAVIARGCTADVSVGSKPEVTTLERHVRSTPRSRHRQAAPACPKSANLGSHHPRLISPVSECQPRWWCNQDQHELLESEFSDQYRSISNVEMMAHFTAWTGTNTAGITCRCTAGYRCPWCPMNVASACAPVLRLLLFGH
jgi:hypothetical protein